MAAHTDGYNEAVERLREVEYPMLKGTTYLDHAGTTLYPKSLMDRFTENMMSNLYGNPHSASESSQRSARLVEDTRLKLLQLFGADPQHFDVVFVANATAGVKLILEAFRGSSDGFDYAYHRDCHTSLVGIRECAAEHKCLESDEQTEAWLMKECDYSKTHSRNTLFAYPAQSNMNGRRLPLSWAAKVRTSACKDRPRVYSLLDAAAMVSTTPLDFSEPDSAPDFTVLSLYKIFGFPDLGAILIRNESATIFEQRQYFGGGTVDMVLCAQEQWHARKTDSLHDRLEDGTLPIHSILALEAAITVHADLFGSLERVSRHTLFLAKKLHDELSNLKHANGRAVCEIYKHAESSYDKSATQGPVVSFNICNAHGAWVSNNEVEKLAGVRQIDLRTGGLCNPGGIASSLGLAPWEMKKNFSAGQRCGNENDVMFGKPTGMIRLSLGAMSTMQDVVKFTDFMREFFVEETRPTRPHESEHIVGTPPTQGSYFVESVTIYPIKSCAGWSVIGKAWPVRKEGLAWDREWCLVHTGTSTSLSQKRYPKMAFVKPEIDLSEGVLRIRYLGNDSSVVPREVTVPLSADPRYLTMADGAKQRQAKVCGDTISMGRYKSEKLTAFFTRAVGVACQLARLPPTGVSGSPERYSKARLQQHQLDFTASIPGAFPSPTLYEPSSRRPILLANESPILVVSRSSLNRLNELIKAAGGKAAQADVFRANIVVSEDHRTPPGMEQPYAEDHWRYLRVGRQYFQMLGSCRRCQQICIDPRTAEKNEEPFLTLAKTRRFDGKVFFGQHACHLPFAPDTSVTAQHPTISVGDVVYPFVEGEEPDSGLLEATMA